MARYDVLDEATIAATPREIVAALDDEAAGRSHWWLPWLRVEQRGDRRYSEVGGQARITVSSQGRPDRRWGNPQFEARVVAVEPERRIVLEYFAGDFLGMSEWRFEPVDAAHTHVSLRWVADPAGSMRLWARLVDVPRHHSSVIRKGFKAIERYVADQRAKTGA